MRLDFQSARTKAIVHAVQAFIIFIAWILTIAVYTRKGSNDGRTDYYFALCWVTIPVIVYLAAFPLWPRTRRFANIYAFVTLDLFFSILWFAAWVTMTSYVVGEKHNKSDTTRRKLSEGTIVLGVIVCLLFVLTSFMSIRRVVDYRRTGTMPDYTATDNFAAQSNDAFSAAPMHDFDEEEDYRMGGPPTEVNGPEDYDHIGASSLGHAPHESVGSGHGDDEYSLLHQSEIDEMGPGGGRQPSPYDPTSHSGMGAPSVAAPSSTTGYELPPVNTGYGGAYGQHMYEEDYGLGTYGR